MKKIIALFAVLVICLSFVSSVGQVFAAKDADTLTIIDLVSLKKHIVANSDYNADFDYNGDNNVNAQDLIVLRNILLVLPYTPVEPDDDNKEDSKFDDDGYYNDVVKP